MAFEIPEWLKYDIARRRERLGVWWEELAARRWVNENPVFVTAVAGGSVFLLLMVIVWLSRPQHVPQVAEYKREWYYDLNTGELFTAKRGLTPPIEAPSGPLADGRPAGVRAYVLSYSDEPNEAERFIAFLEVADPNGLNEVADKAGPRLTPARRWGRGRLLRRLEDEQWVAGDSPAGQAIFSQAFAPGANGRRPSYYQPR
ncbi:MAG: hypothetical protein JXN61_12135 [Sedimentisphaerales bacterium]|nr:hypothetical protein [Sedimentisphaerales bacterium]